MLNYKNPIKQAKKTEEMIVVDDLAPMREIVQFMLKSNRYSNVHSLETAKLALSMLASRPIALVITDWNMPNMTGIELLRNVRSDLELKSLPFLMVTAESEKEKVIEAIKSGVNNYIIKPFTAEILKVKMEKIFERMAGKS